MNNDKSIHHNNNIILISFGLKILNFFGFKYTIQKNPQNHMKKYIENYKKKQFDIYNNQKKIEIYIKKYIY